MFSTIIDFAQTEIGGGLIGLLGGMPILLAPVYFNDDKTAKLICGIILGLAAGVYINSGLGIYEMPFAVLMLYLAYRATDSYTFVGLGWLMHALLDIIHHNIGTPTFSYYNMSSLGCAVLDIPLGLLFIFGNKYIPRRSRLKYT